eukprot:TRINITY_DN8588_c0_g1_i1.p1 TRINITY_DN8588_c0_g1~~TRINITY_DN8588_c0_g1_i1.p1  ORF type:complete len:485 (+),score=167.79 TRINITY_DN8588_c0_g1_i1:231-1685(+)
MTSTAHCSAVLGVVHSVAHVQQTRHPRHPNRGVLVHTLLKGLGLVQDGAVMEVADRDLAEAEEAIEEFHDPGYVGALKRASEVRESDDESSGDVQGKGMVDDNDEDIDSDDDEACDLEDLLDRRLPTLTRPNAQYGLVDDCRPFRNVYSYASHVAAGSMLAARRLADRTYLRAAHWEGGRHHAGQSQASGFCYVADVVLAVQELLHSFKRVLVIDVDVHHGDGTQEAFYRSDRVFTLSFHMDGPGVFPSDGAGCFTKRGARAGMGHNLNFPLHPGCTDELYHYAFSRVAMGVRAVFDPEVVVVVCGGDVLCGDPVGELNVSLPCMLQCLGYVRDWNLPTLLLGGGGYDDGLTSRYWAAATAMMGVTPGEVEGECVTERCRRAATGEHPPTGADPFDTHAFPVLSSDAVRRLGTRHLSRMPSTIPPDSIPDATYRKFYPYSFAPPLPALPPAPHANTLEHIQCLVHVSLEALLRVEGRDRRARGA